MRSVFKSLTLLAVAVALVSAQDDKIKTLETEAEKLMDANTRLIPGWVRLSFHDCVGGCDGCVDLNNPGNHGLDNFINGALSFRDQHAPEFSDADIFAFLGVAAIKKGAKKGGGSLNITFTPGRTDCDKSNGFPARDIPAGNRLDSVQFLRNEFDLSIPEAVALLGCHSLGRAHTQFSGFEGPWDFSEDKLESGYFLNMRAAGWEPEQVDNPQTRSFQWSKNIGSTKFMMLHADMIMLKDFTVDADDRPSCPFTTCKDASTAQWIQLFADDKVRFHQFMQTAFQKMVDKKPVQPDSPYGY